MTDAVGTRFVPRDMFAQPSAFGNVGSIPGPADGVARTDPRYRAAVVQHMLARQVKDRLALRGLSQKEFLTPMESVRGLSATRMGRVLRGTQIATFGDLAFWTSEFPDVSPPMGKFIASWANAATDSATE